MPEVNSKSIFPKAASQYSSSRLAVATKPKPVERPRQVLLTASNEEKGHWSYQVLIMTKQPGGKNHINTWI